MGGVVSSFTKTGGKKALKKALFKRTELFAGAKAIGGAPLDLSYLSQTSRILVVGDVHGCYDELQNLLKVAEFDGGVKDGLIFVGDLVNKGPESLKVLRFVKNHENWNKSVFAVMGNHEVNAVTPHPDREAWCEEMTPEEEAWIKALPLFLRIPNAVVDETPADSGNFHMRDAIIVHAGVDPNRSPELMSLKEVTNIRSILPDGTVSKHHDGTPWADLWKGPEYVIYGHDAKRGHVRSANAHGLDAGCCFGKKLIALELPSNKVHKVDALQKYVPVKDNK